MKPIERTYEEIERDNQEFIRENTADEPEQPAQEQPSPPVFIERLRKSSKAIAERAAQNIDFAAPILTRPDPDDEEKEQPVIYPYTLNAITGQTASHKSRIAENVASAFLAKDTTQRLLGLKRCTARNYAILLIDTERNLKDQLPFAVQEIREKAGYSRTEQVPFFDTVSLLEIRRHERTDAMREFFTAKKKEWKGRHIVVILDVLTDICENFNDPRFTMPLIDELNDMINTCEVTICAVIHQNPGGLNDKARGHLGTELENKSSSIITVSAHPHHEGWYAVKCKKQRSAKPFSSFYIEYDSEKRGLAEVDVKTVAAAGAFVIDWARVFANGAELRPAEVYTRLTELYAIQRRQGEKYVSDAKKRNELTATGNANKTRLKITETKPENEQMFEKQQVPDFGND